MKTLHIIEGAYRCNLEEQDDPALWLFGAMRAAGAELTLLLAGNAVNYAVRAQDASGLRFGEKRQTQPPEIAEDLARQIGLGAQALVVEEDIAERGLERGDLIAGVRGISRATLPQLIAAHGRVFRF